MKASLKIFGIAALAVVLSGCGNFPLPPASEQGRPMRPPVSGWRVVQPGDTLYSIAWESGHDYQDVAHWNRIPPPYVIKPGQRLQLFPPSGTGAVSRPEPKPSIRSEAPKKSSTEKPVPRAPVATASKLSWTWPAQGELQERFSVNGPSKGIDIAGRTGQPVMAAEAGQIVYQGSGLRGYGQLIIIKHNDDFLSAYAHCDRIHVREGDVVKRGQKIADMGSTGTDKPKLHFEVRYRGAPVDPLDHLPRK